jgi:hypothetical protein
VSKRSWEHDYVNHDVAPHAEKLENGNDVFDMRKRHFIFCCTPKDYRYILGCNCHVPTYFVHTEPFSTTLTAGAAGLSHQRQQLEQELWFHGPISRKDAETILKNVGSNLKS